MSSQSAPKLVNLAPELVEHVLRQVGDKKDLSNARLACKTLDKHAAKELFKNVFISPAEEDMNGWNGISQDDTVRQIPRHAIIHTHSDIEDHGLAYFRETEEIDEEFEDAIAALSRFPNLDSVEIGFTPECIGVDDEDRLQVPETTGDREQRLKLVFQAIKDRAADKKNRTIRKLTIINLRNYPHPDFTSSDLFREVMGQLEELHISLVQEFNEHGPDGDYEAIELLTFPPYFCSDWLEPISNNLKALSIYHGTNNWGPFPGYFDFSGISFPKLATLSLGYYTLAHNNDIDWILAIKSLRKLILHNCMINSWISIAHSEMATWRVKTHDWTPMPDNDVDNWYATFSYGGKWSQFIDRIADDLPNLVDFRFDEGLTDTFDGSKYGVNHRNNCGTRVFPQRYIYFDNRNMPTFWHEADNDGDFGSWFGGGFPVNRHEESLEGDQKSLDALLEKMRSRQ